MFQKLTLGRTSIIIAHRLQTIQEADRVMVMDKGQIVEIEAMRSLSKQKGYTTPSTIFSFKKDNKPPSCLSIDFHMSKTVNDKIQSGVKFRRKRNNGDQRRDQGLEGF